MTTPPIPKPRPCPYCNCPGHEPDARVTVGQPGDGESYDEADDA